MTSCSVTSLRFEIKLFPSLVTRGGDIKFIPLLFHLMVGWCSTLNVGALCCLYFTPSLYKFDSFLLLAKAWALSESHAAAMNSVWTRKLVASEAWEKGKIILVGCHYLKVSQFCVLQREPLQLKGWDWLEGSPFTMLGRGSKTEHLHPSG